MAELTDFIAAMVSFQQAIREGEIAPQRADLDRDVSAAVMARCRLRAVIAHPDAWIAPFTFGAVESRAGQ